MKKILTALLVAGFTFIYASAQCSEADKAALEKLDRDWGTASQNADRAALTAIYADDYSNVNGNETKQSAIDAAIKQAQWDKANPGKAAKVSFDHYMISCTPTTATITHRNKAKIPQGAGNDPTVEYSRSIHVLEKRNGRWQVVSNAGHGLDDYMTLGYMEMDWVDAMKNRNAQWFENNLAPDYTAASMMTGGLIDKAGIVEDMRTSKMKFSSAKILDMDIKINGNTAIVTGVGHGVGTDESGAPFDMKVRFMDTFVKRDGRWMPFASQATLMPESQQTAKK